MQNLFLSNCWRLSSGMPVWCDFETCHCYPKTIGFQHQYINRIYAWNIRYQINQFWVFWGELLFHSLRSLRNHTSPRSCVYSQWVFILILTAPMLSFWIIPEFCWFSRTLIEWLHRISPDIYPGGVGFFGLSPDSIFWKFIGLHPFYPINAEAKEATLLNLGSIYRNIYVLLLD